MKRTSTESSTVFKRNNGRPDTDIVKTAEALAFVPVIIVALLFFGMGTENASQSELVPDAAGSNISNATTNITAGETQVLVHSNAKAQGEELSQDELKTKGVALKLKL
ncbi:MAG: hypothetical protein Q8O17_00780 [Candidatus Methanoperedens sp.]|nr:hypothetical protein [Candidatus Methanoperedens sp.]